ncbi:Cdk2-associated and cullin domain-containing protein 1-like [Plakobranchus ocellatus]|uniref:Cdk2-associated and cullin domain-containing protein 1-like n=1 Tax=Plakobranchus ocellatus TaxID=259542 RepID=A0AAV4DQT4_9GAST|nr:Cdk2-associated and cullin domain-containing protein 1-like [Plakobranchus ocellatus]
MDEPMESSFDAGDTAQHHREFVLDQSHTPNAILNNQNAVVANTDSALTNPENCKTDCAVEDTSYSKTHTCFTPLLRPGSMVMMVLTEEDYETQYWPKLKTAIDQLLNMKPGAYSPISYEQMYSCVYKCVCKQFSERLYNDLLSHLSTHMEYLNSELKSCGCESIPFIEKFSFLMHQYMQALSGIVPIFNYMNRFYVETKLKSDLNEELKKLFRTKVVDAHITVLLRFLEEVSAVPFAISPPTMASVVKNLYALNKDYSKLNPGLFSRYLPNILPPTDPALLEQYAEEARRYQAHIANMSEFRSRGSSSKRVFEDDISVN